MLYESTGNIGGTTQLNTITLDGKVTTLADRGSKVFGEGLTILNDEVFQLTWQERQVFVYDTRRQAQAADAQPARRLGPLARRHQPPVHRRRTVALLRRSEDLQDRQVGDHPRRQGTRSPASTSSNASTASSTATSSPPARSCVSIRETGCIDAVADLGVLWEVMTPDERASTNSAENVLNGIAYDAKTGLFYLTGKRWRTIFVGRFREPEP